MATDEEHVTNVRKTLNDLCLVMQAAHEAGLSVDWSGINRGPNPGRNSKFAVRDFKVTKDLTPQN